MLYSISSIVHQHTNWYKGFNWAVVVVQLVELLLLTPECSGLIPVIGKFINDQLFKSGIEKTKVEKKEARN